MTVTQNSREIHHVFERATWIRIALKSFYKKRDTLLIVCIALKHHPRNSRSSTSYLVFPIFIIRLSKLIFQSLLMRMSEKAVQL